MANSKDKKETAVVEYDNLPTTLKEIAKKGEDGQFITLVDIEETKTILTKLSERHKDLKVTKDNYKKEGAEAEKELRQTRYALQRIHKSNNGFLNDIKKAEKETYDGLIDLIQPQEQRIYEDIAVFKEQAKREKEEAERKEKERVEKIEKTLKETEFALEKAVIQGKTQKDVEEYDKFLEELANNFPTFEEMEFQAKRLHAIYKAKREQLVKQVQEQEDLERRRVEQEEKDKKRAEQLEKIYIARKNHLIKKGFVITHLETFEGFGLEYTTNEVKEKDEVEWYELQEQVDNAITKAKEEQEAREKAEQEEKERKEKEEKERKEKEEREALKKARKDWDDLVTIYEGLGGDPKLWKLKKDEIPSSGDIERLTKATRDLQNQKKTLKLKAVKKDIEPFKNDTLEFLKEMETKIDGATFKNAESKSILENFKTRTLEVVNEVFGEVYNK